MAYNMTTPKLDYIKAQIQHENYLNELFMDVLNKDDSMTELENQITCVYLNDYESCDREILTKKTIIEKVLYLVDEWKSIGLIEAFINCELYANYFNFHTELNDDEYNTLAIKYIVKNNLV